MLLSFAFVFFSFTFVLASVEFNSWHYHSSALAGDWIYIDGGLVPFEFDLTLRKWIYGPANKTYALNLSEDWTSSSLTMITTNRPSSSLSLLSQSLWFDGGNIIYCFGGDVYHGPDGQIVQNASPAPPESIWGFKLEDKGQGFWSEFLGPTGPKPFPRDLYRPSSGASAADNTSGYYIAGFRSKFTSPSGFDTWVQSPGLLKFRFDTMDLTNTTDGGFPLSQITNHEGSGAMISIPNYGTSGILALLGGGEYKQPMAFNNITLYDKYEGKWYYQIASGDVPDQRVKFCAVGVQGGGDSFEIFIHGGRSIAKQNLAPPDDELFILSLPAFRWFRANCSSPSFPRFAHTCHAAKATNQMIMIGGQGHNDSDMTSADPTNHGIAVFDMTKLAFKNSYLANASVYEPPEVVQRYYSADSSNKYPSSWTQPEVKYLFQETPSPFNSSCITTAPAGFCRTAQPGLSNATITGLVLGAIGVFVLIVTATVFAFCVKKKIPPGDDYNGVDGKGVICADVQEFAAEQAPQEIMTEREDLAELSV